MERYFVQEEIVFEVSKSYKFIMNLNSYLVKLLDKKICQFLASAEGATESGAATLLLYVQPIGTSQRIGELVQAQLVSLKGWHLPSERNTGNGCSGPQRHPLHGV